MLLSAEILGVIDILYLRFSCYCSVFIYEPSDLNILIRKRKYSFIINYYFSTLLLDAFNDRKENVRIIVNIQVPYVTNTQVLLSSTSFYV